MKEQPPPAARFAAELVGTFFLAFTVVSNVHAESVGAAVSVGATLTAMVYSLGSVSGGHFNPAVTLSIWLAGRRKISSLDAVGYTISQLVGGCSAVFMWWIASVAGPEAAKELALRPPGPGAGYTENVAALVEVLYTCALCYVVLNVATTDSKGFGNCPNAYFGVAIGLTVTAAALAIGPISGCSLNPAISIGLTCVAWLVKGPVPLNHFMYVLAPSVGAFAAAAGFFAARGGLYSRHEYAEFDEEPPLRAPPPDFAPPSDSVVLDLSNALTLPAEVNTHDLVCALRWKGRPKRTGDASTVDIDLSCIKFSAKGECLGGVYFAKKADRGIRHSGDEVLGHADTPEHEQIVLRLCDTKPNVHALLFVAIVYSDQNFFDLDGYTIRLVDMTDGKKEFCRFEKDNTPEGKNALIAAVLYRSGMQWCFKALDDFHKIPPNSSYRALMPQLQSLMHVQLQVGRHGGSSARSFSARSTGSSMV